LASAGFSLLHPGEFMDELLALLGLQRVEKGANRMAPRESACSACSPPSLLKMMCLVYFDRLMFANFHAC
jgi:hypothetical protein